MLELVVTEPFALDNSGTRLRFAKGDAITDSGLVERVEREFPRHVVRRLAAAGKPA
jgi:hypothetical protein